MKTLFFECNMGAAGDMLMSALYEICEQKDVFLTTMNEVFAPFHITLSPETVTKCGIHGTQFHVEISGREELPHGAPEQHDSPEPHGHSHTGYSAVCEKINGLSLPNQVKEDACAIYRLIGEAEAKVHGSVLEQIHFHEIGSLDALADVTGCALLMYLIAPEQIVCSPIHLGNGFVQCAHGILPVPAPATAELLKGIPCYTGTITGELCTPTGAAILKYFVNSFSGMPLMTPDAIGYGMGHKDFGIANCIRAFFGNDFEIPSTDAPAPDIGDTDLQEKEPGFPDDDTILCISCNIDDMTGEAMGLATEIFMAAGALDVYTIPIQMKKNRPGILLSCICNPDDKDKFTGLFFLHTSTRGVRYQLYSRAKLESTFETRPTAYGDIRIKKSSGYGIRKEKPEFEDLKSVVLKNGCSFSLDEITKAILH